MLLQIPRQKTAVVVTTLHCPRTIAYPTNPMSAVVTIKVALFPCYSRSHCANVCSRNNVALFPFYSRTHCANMCSRNNVALSPCYSRPHGANVCSRNNVGLFPCYSRSRGANACSRNNVALFPFYVPDHTVAMPVVVTTLHCFHSIFQIPRSQCLQ